MAKFQIGQPRPTGAGRKPGSQNRLNVEFKEAIEKKINVPEEILQLYVRTPKDSDKIRLLELLCAYMFPKPRTQEELDEQQIITFLKAAIEAKRSESRDIIPSE